MAQQMGILKASIVPLDKWGKMVYNGEQQGCEANRQALTVPTPSKPSQEDIMKHLALAFAALLSCSPAIAQAKATAGDYAAKSTKYQQYVTVCESSGTPSLEDEAAQRLERMSAAEYQKHVDMCPKKSVRKLMPQQEANNQHLRRPARRGGSLDTRDIEALAGIAQKAFGAPPADATGYTAHATKTAAAPARGCVQVDEYDAKRGMLKRWKCPPGTIRRLGW